MRLQDTTCLSAMLSLNVTLVFQVAGYTLHKVKDSVAPIVLALVVVSTGEMNYHNPPTIAGRDHLISLQPHITAGPVALTPILRHRKHKAEATMEQWAAA